MPATIKKPKAQKTQPSFATADKIARAIWKGTHHKSEKPIKKKLTHLSLAVSEWLKSPDPEAYSPALSEFTFTDPGQSFKKIWKVPLEIDHLHDGDMVIKFPGLVTSETAFPPPDTYSIFCHGKLAVIDVSTGIAICISDFIHIVIYSNKYVRDRTYKLKATGNQGNLTIVSLNLNYSRYNGDDKPLTNIGKSSGIVAAIYRK